MPVTRNLLVCAIAGLGILAGCAGGAGIVYNRNFTTAYSPASLSAMRQALPVETHGAPRPGVSQEEVTAATVEGLVANGPRWTQLNFSGNADEARDASYRLRIAYAAAADFDRSDLCSEDLPPGSLASDPASGRTVAALCRNGRYVSIAEGTPGVGADIKSPAFADFVGLIGRQVLPRRNPSATLPRRE